MPNVLVTPEWITREFLREYDEIQSSGAVLKVRVPQRFSPVDITPVSSTPINGKALLALGAAAVIANPEPISRRSLFGLNWFARKGKK